MAIIPMGAVPAWHAARKPATTAIVTEEGATSWSALAERVADRANALLALNIRPGDRIAMLLPNSNAFIETMFAVWAVGAIPLPLSPALADQERKALLALAAPALVIGDVSDEGPWGTLPASWTPKAEGLPLPFIVPATSWKIMASGGSTGRPKLIVADRPATTDPGIYELFPWELHKGRLGRPDGVMLCPGPLYHNGPLVHAFMNLFAGSTVILMRRFDAASALSLIEDHGVEFAYLVPTMMRRMVALPAEEREARDLSRLAGIIHTAAACPPDLKRQWIDWLGPERVWETYGSTEAVASTVINGVDWLTHPGSVGQFFFNARCEIRAPDGTANEAGQIGDIWVRPGHSGQTFHYIGTKPREQDGWFSFGDIGALDEQGYLYVSDRRDDLIIRGGNNVYPAEVEAALEAHPCVVAAAVIGLPDDDMGERIHAIVQIRASLASTVLQRFLQDRLTPYKRPQSFEFVTFDLRDAAGKLRRSALRDKRIAALAISG